MTEPTKRNAAGAERRLSIELSTLAFFQGDEPREISLRSCSFPVANQSDGFFALYGTQGKQVGFMAARAYADEAKLKYTVVDLVVELTAQNAQLMKPTELNQFDFLNLARSSKALSEALSIWLACTNDPILTDELSEALASQPLRQIVLRWPELVASIGRIKQCEHLKVIAFLGMTRVSDRPLGLAFIQPKFWSSIKDATCRLNPKIRITL